MITLHYTLTKEDYFNFYYQAGWLNPYKKKKAIKTAITRFLSFAAMLVFVKLLSKHGTFDSFFFYSISLLACIFIVPLFSISGNYRRLVASITDNPMNAHFFGEMQINIAETGIFTRGEFAETKFQWPGIVKKEENKDYYFLYLNSEQAILIPKRAFKSETDKQQTEKIFGQHISFNAEVGHLVKD